MTSRNSPSFQGCLAQPGDSPAPRDFFAGLLLRLFGVIPAEQGPLLNLRAIGQHTDSLLPLRCLLDTQLSADLLTVNRGGVGHASSRHRLRFRACTNGQCNQRNPNSSEGFIHGPTVHPPAPAQPLIQASPASHHPARAFCVCVPSKQKLTSKLIASCNPFGKYRGSKGSAQANAVAITDSVTKACPSPDGRLIAAERIYSA